MSKHKKTRKEKIIADYRHQVYILENKSLSSFNKPAPSIVTNEDFHPNAYIIKDVLKTGMLTCAIITAQIVLFFLLKKHILLIPNLNY